MEQKYIDLIKKAIEIRKNAYVPYSNYSVGAALLCKNGDVYVGCNIENASYGLTICAERTAIFKAVSEGQRHIDAIAITGCHLDHLTDDNNLVSDADDTDDYAYPCGACRQVLAEFLPNSGDIDVIVAKSTNDYKEFKLSELLPGTFKL